MVDLNEQLIQPPDFSIHLSTDKPTIQVKGYTNMGGSGANWVALSMGGVLITLFTPSSVGVLEIIDELRKGQVVCDFNLDSVDCVDEKATPIISLPVEITSYNAHPDQTDSTPTITASGVSVEEDICALSRDIEREFGLEFGDLIHIEGYGIFRFQDRMNKRIKRGVDIFKWSKEEALEIGRRKGIVRFTPRVVQPERKTEQRVERKTEQEMKRG